MDTHPSDTRTLIKQKQINNYMKIGPAICMSKYPFGKRRTHISCSTRRPRNPTAEAEVCLLYLISLNMHHFCCLILCVWSLQFNAHTHFVPAKKCFMTLTARNHRCEVSAFVCLKKIMEINGHIFGDDMKCVFGVRLKRICVVCWCDDGFLKVCDKRRVFMSHR